MGASVPSTSNSTAELPGCERNGRSGSGGTGAYSSAVRPALVLLGIGLAAGFLSALFGVGGGLVVVPALVMLQRYDLRRASATSLAAIGFTAVFGAVRYGVRGDVHWLDALLVGLPAVAGVGLGTWLQPRIPTRWLELAFAAVAGAVSVKLLAF
jgi:uncharacterized membrane protein YfcA